MKQFNIRIFTALALSFLTVATPSLAQNNKWVILEQGKFVRFTDDGRKLLTQFRDALRARKAAFQKEFKQYETIDHAIDVVRLMKGNMLLHGGPGGGKTYALSKKLQSERKAVKVECGSEFNPLDTECNVIDAQARPESGVFDIQMNQMMSEHPFVGGQNFDAARRGKFEVNVAGSLCESTVGVIDEAHNANPAALAALMSILNERQVKAGNKVINCPIETIFFTLNQNPYELEQQFTENGWRATAQAMLNRFTVKAFVPNWIQKSDQAALDDSFVAGMDDWYYGQNAQIPTAFDWATPFDWSQIADLAKALLRPTDEFKSIARDFVQYMRSQTIDAVESSKVNAKSAYSADEIMPYAPTAKLSERLREKIISVVLVSIVLDILNSKLVDNITTLENMLKNLPFNRFAVGPLSLWRAHLMLTTISFGNTALTFPKGADGKRSVDIDFGDFFTAQDSLTKELIYKPEDKREEQMIAYIKSERERFKTKFLTLIAQHKDVLEATSSFDGLLGCLNDVTKAQNLQDVERLLFVLKRS